MNISTHRGSGENFRRFDQATLDALRHGLPEYIRTQGVELKNNGTRLIGRCPVHQDNKPSFALYGEGHTQAGCFPCGFTGDVFAVSRWLGRSGTFPEAVADVAQVLGVMLPTSTGNAVTRRTTAGIDRQRSGPPRTTPSKPPAIVLPPLPAGFEDASRAARWNLFQECSNQSETARIVAADLGTDIETLRGLTFTSDAVGIEFPCDRRGRPRIFYLYEHGAKIRHPKGHEPRFEWNHGKAALPWRWHFAARPEVKTVFITEGETDAIAAIAAGLENLHPKNRQECSAVIACPGTACPESWGQLFRGKSVVIIFDRDEPGRQAAIRAASIIRPHAASVKVANWKGLATL